jgi:hypothetical protein
MLLLCSPNEFVELSTIPIAGGIRKLRFRCEPLLSARLPLRHCSGRAKVRMTSLDWSAGAELEASLSSGRKAGFRAFQVPVPAPGARNQGQAYVRSVRAVEKRENGPDSGDSSAFSGIEGGPSRASPGGTRIMLKGKNAETFAAIRLTGHRVWRFLRPQGTRMFEC